MQLVQLLKSKIHHLRVTYANPDYVGSIEVCGDLMDRAGFINGELVHVWAVDHESRIVTYIFRGPKGVAGLNGGAARYFKQGDRLIIAAFTLTDEPIMPRMILVDENNAFVRDLEPFTTHG